MAALSHSLGLWVIRRAKSVCYPKKLVDGLYNLSCKGRAAIRTEYHWKTGYVKKDVFYQQFRPALAVVVRTWL